MMIYVALWNPHPVLQHWLRPQFQALVDAACEKQGQGWMPVGLHHLVPVRVQLLRRGVSQRVQHNACGYTRAWARTFVGASVEASEIMTLQSNAAVATYLQPLAITTQNQ